MPQLTSSPRIGKPSPAKPSVVRLTHPDRVLFQEQGITKADLATYYAEVAERMLEHVAGRPLMLVRCPEGQSGQCFHQKHPTRGLPRDVVRVPIMENSGTTAEHMMVRDAKGLIGLVQIGALEIHTWGSHADQLDYPDQLTFDLDPDEALPWPRIVEAAHTVHKQLEALGLEAYLKTTGGKGLHLVTPIAPTTARQNSFASSVTLFVQVRKQWRDDTSRGVSPFLFIGQLGASIGFLSYSLQLENWVFTVTNTLTALAAVTGLWITYRHRGGKGKGKGKGRAETGLGQAGHA